MHLVVFLLFGLIVGTLARWLVPGRDSGGWLASLAIGVVGSFIGGFLANLVGAGAEGKPAGFVASLIGAILLVMGYHAVARRASA
ncbi:MAG TPA: GlsB/YeaQ/YmgE family stress response membrane protein [Polyangiaceae bacterium]|nr:GlsB/YeaQ/YmgE family stress response membrane protein [Polyangiaceae bacterium]